MKQVLLIGLALFLGISVFSQGSEPFIVKNYSGVKKVKASTAGGNITVGGGDVREATVKVYIRSSDYNQKLSDSEIRERLESDYTLKMETQGDVLVLQARSKSNIHWKKGLSISFEVLVPKLTSNDLTTSGGNITLRGVEGKQDFVTSGGNLTVKELKGNIKGTTSGGNITAEGLSDNIELVTSGGNVSAEDCKGKMKLTTSGGNLHLEDLEGTISASTSGGNVNGETLKGEILAATSGGNVELDEIFGSLQAATSGGHMRVSIQEVGKYVKLGNSGGNIHLDLPAGKGYDLDIKGSKINTEALSNYSGSMSESRLNGKLNGGGTPVTIDRAEGVRLSFHK
ncbi:MAG TPA: hypothetical protein VLA58_01620 [Chitinophagaceae bacterium]|nr:hypothetical protein [Chitinophagaceae bacterium]